MLHYERACTESGFDIVIGVDEAGRGPLAGPVVAAAVFSKDRVFQSRIDDSKKLTPRQRELAASEIIRESICGIGIVNEKIIDRINILEATKRAMEEAVAMLVEQLECSLLPRVHVLVDGTIPLALDFPYTVIVRGDSQSLSIACASIVAKVTRDTIMDFYDSVFPEYDFNRHKGYPTKAHRNALKKFGLSPIHRVTFSCKEMMS